MGQYRVWLEDRALSYVELKAPSERAARRKAERLLDDDRLLDRYHLHLQQSSWEVNAVEQVT